VRVIVLLTLLTMIGAAVTVHQLPSDARAAAVVAGSHDVASVAIDGEGLPFAQLREAIATRVGERVDTDQLERDRASLQTTLEARGFLGAKVGSPTVTFGARGAYVVFPVERGPLYHLRSVTLEGPSWAAAGVVTLASGDEANSERLASARRAAEDTLARSGKRLRVELVMHPDPTEALVDVTLVTR
jgi:outer membrane protein assembly factor BamA